jgi:hypothetical protein
MDMMKLTSTLAAALLGVGAAVTGCATPGTRPGDMSVAAHEAAAMSSSVHVAAKHRAAAQALRDGESQACAGMAERDRDLSAFFRREDIESFSALYEPSSRTTTALKGSILVMRPAPGVTAEWLQRNIECHIARSATLGHGADQMSKCPFALNGINVEVRSGGDKFLVYVRSANLETAREIWRRTQTLRSVAVN